MLQPYDEERRYTSIRKSTELVFLNNLWGLGTEYEQGYRTGPPGYIGWRNSFLEIDSLGSINFKNTGSDEPKSLESIPGSGSENR